MTINKHILYMFTFKRSNNKYQRDGIEVEKEGCYSFVFFVFCV